MSLTAADAPFVRALAARRPDLDGPQLARLVALCLDLPELHPGRFALFLQAHVHRWRPKAMKPPKLTQAERASLADHERKVVRAAGVDAVHVELAKRAVLGVVLGGGHE